MKEMQLRRESTVAKVGTAGAVGVALAACAACCAPLLAPLLAWLGLSSLGMATTGWYMEIAVVSAVALGGFLLLRRRTAIKRSRSCRSMGAANVAAVLRLRPLPERLSNECQ